MADVVGDGRGGHGGTHGGGGGGGVQEGGGNSGSSNARPATSSLPAGAALNDASLSPQNQPPQGALSPHQRQQQSFFFALLIAKVCAVGILVCLGALIAFHLHEVGEILKEAMKWVKNQGPLSPFYFTLLYIALVCIFIPAEMMNVSAGFIFTGIYGKALGFCVAMVCCLVGSYGGATCCFLTSRYLLFIPIDRLCNGHAVYIAFNRAVKEGGTLFVAMIRLSPILPFTLTSYLLGMTPLELHHLWIGSLSSLPLIAAFVYFGLALERISDLPVNDFHLTWKGVLLIVFGLVTAFGGIGYIGALTKKKMAESLESVEAEEAQRQRLLLGDDNRRATAAAITSNANNNGNNNEFNNGGRRVKVVVSAGRASFDNSVSGGGGGFEASSARTTAPADGGEERGSTEIV